MAISDGTNTAGLSVGPKTSKQKREEKAASIAELDSKQEGVLDDKMALGRPVQWETMFRFMDGKVTGMTPEEAYKLSQARRCTLLDVRSPDDGASDIEWMNNGFFIAGSMRYCVLPKAINIPLYSLIGGVSLYKQIRRVGFSYVFGVLNGQELRMDFVKEVMERFPDKKTPLVVFCDASRPTMEKAMGRDYGIRSRSLQAVYYLTKVGGYTNVKYMDGGFYGWYNSEQDLPVYEFDDPDAKPFAQRNLPKMLSILTFLTFVTSIKSGLVFIPFLFFAPPGSLCTAGFCELENLRDLFVAAAKNPLSL